VKGTLLFRTTWQCFVDEVDEGTEVTFTSPNPEVYPLPNPRYLAFHAAVAKVVHMAGMAGHRALSDELGTEYLDGLLGIAQIYIYNVAQ